MLEKLRKKFRILNDPGLSLHQRDLVLKSNEDGTKYYSEYGNKQEINKKYEKIFFSLFISRS